MYSRCPETCYHLSIMVSRLRSCCSEGVFWRRFLACDGCARCCNLTSSWVTASCCSVEISFIHHCGVWGSCRYWGVQVTPGVWRWIETKVRISRFFFHLDFKITYSISRRSTGGAKSGGGRAISTGGGAGSMWKFYTGDDSPGIKM